MMTSLFSSFDPSNSFFSMNWLVMLFPLVFLGLSGLYTLSVSFLRSVFFKGLGSEFSNNMKSVKSQEVSMLMISLFVLIMVVNLISLVPSSFSGTGQISVNLPLALLMWFTLMIFSWFNKTEISLSHLVPSGTPFSLMVLMVLIELTSNVIRPITLSVRLTANIISGHILISLVEEFILSGYSPLPVSFLSISILTILETGVSIIQAYIFSTLVTMYLAENH